MQKSELANELRLRLDCPESLEQLKAHIFAHTSPEDFDVEAINGITEDAYRDTLTSVSDDVLVGFYLKGTTEVAHVDQLIEQSESTDAFLRRHDSLSLLLAAVEAGFRDMFDTGMCWRQDAKGKHVKRMIVASRRADLAAIGAIPGVPELVDAQIKFTADMFNGALRRRGGSDEAIASYLDPYLQILRNWGRGSLDGGRDGPRHGACYRHDDGSRALACVSDLVTALPS